MDWRAEYRRIAGSSREHFVDEYCEKCGGSGYYTYSSTVAWRSGGVGGQALTSSVCDKCWGSGEQGRPWPSWRQHEAEVRALRRALHDAIKRPLGVVPDSALPFYDPKRYYGEGEG